MTQPNSSEDSQRQQPMAERAEQFNTHLLEQYKLYVRIADAFSERRVQLNKSFLIFHAIFGFLMWISFQARGSRVLGSYDGPNFLTIGVCVAGVVLCIIWASMIR